MIQALHAILGEKEQSNKTPHVTMLYGSRISQDILGKEILDQWSSDYPDKLESVHILSHEPTDSEWKGARGFITKEMVQKHFPAPTDEKFQIWVCGPPAMYSALAGPRTESDSVTGLLGEMGYKPEQVYKF